MILSICLIILRGSDTVIADITIILALNVAVFYNTVKCDIDMFSNDMGPQIYNATTIFIQKSGKTDTATFYSEN